MSNGDGSAAGYDGSRAGNSNERPGGVEEYGASVPADDEDSGMSYDSGVEITDESQFVSAASFLDTEVCLEDSKILAAPKAAQAPKSRKQRRREGIDALVRLSCPVPERRGAVFPVREDLAPSLLAAMREVESLGGLLTGTGFREIGAVGGGGRNLLSLHKVGRAIDLDMNRAMNNRRQSWAVELERMDDDGKPFWHVWHRVDEKTPVQDPRVEERKVKLVLYTKKEKNCLKVVPTAGRFFSITNIMSAHGWDRISGHNTCMIKCELANYRACEWWRFQNTTGLVLNETTFGDELRRIYEEETIMGGLPDAKDNIRAVWRGVGFRVVK